MIPTEGGWIEGGLTAAVPVTGGAFAGLACICRVPPCARSLGGGTGTGVEACTLDSGCAATTISRTDSENSMALEASGETRLEGNAETGADAGARGLGCTVDANGSTGFSSIAAPQ